MKNKKLYKSSKKKMIFGVCGGFANYFNIDVTIVRILFVILAFIKFIGVILYLVCAIIMPSDFISDDDAEEKKSQKKVEKKEAPHSDSDFDSYFKN